MKKIVFILGQARSGTTLLNKVLSAHPDIAFINGEFDDLPFFYYNQHLYERYGDQKYSVMAKDLLMYPYFKQPKVDINADSFKGMIDGFLDHYRKVYSKNIIGVKIARNISSNVDMIKDVFKDAYCITIIRDPRDVCLSLRKAPLGTISPFYVGKSWNDSINKIAELENGITPYYEVRYERFISEPVNELKQLCNFLGIPFEKEMLNFHKNLTFAPQIYKLLTQGFVGDNYNKWKKVLTKKKLDLIYAAAGEKIYELEYSDKVYIRRIHLLRKIWEFIFDKTYVYFKGLMVSPRRFYDVKYLSRIKFKRTIMKWVPKEKM